MRTLPLWLILLSLALTPFSAHALWEGKQHNLPASELSQLDDLGLALEARSPCAHVVWVQGHPNPPPSVQDARQYLATIQAVAQRKHRGKVPPWMQEILTALNAADLDACMVPVRRLKTEMDQKAVAPSSTPDRKPRK
jgi:hypothetical protein